MVEALIEKIIVEKIKGALKDYDEIQVFGTWQPTCETDLKGEEETQSICVIGVKAFPRSYSTPTIPDCEI